MIEVIRDFQNRDGHTAVITSDGCRVSYAQLYELSANFAAVLGDEKKLVAIETANELEALVAYVACLLGNHAAMLLPKNALENFPALKSTYNPHFVYRKNDTNWELTVCRPNAPRLDAPYELNVLLSTSGSTGDPKLVMLSGANLDANATSIAEYLELTDRDIAITSLEFSYSFGLSVINSHFVAGGTLLLTTESATSPAFWELFNKYEATSFSHVPYGFELLERMKFSEQDLPSLRYICQAGGRLPAEKVQRYGKLAQQRGWKFFVMYGQTEATARIAYMPPDQLLSAPDSIGVAIPGGHLSIVDAKGQPIECPDTPGELVYRGPNVMLGYATCLGDLANPSRPSELKTGDIAVRSRSGLYKIVGRSSRFAKVFGLRINLERVEQILSEVGIYTATASDDERITVATTSIERSQEISPVISSTLGIPESSVTVLPLQDFPLLSNGKPNYAKIRQLGKLAEEERADRSADDQRNASSQLNSLVAAYKTLLQAKDVTPDSTFVELGGDSLNYVAMSIEIEKVTGHCPNGWERCSIRSLVSDSAESSMKSRHLTFIDTDVVLRAIAIMLIVSQHAGIRTFGGAAFLVLLSGWNLARFNRKSIEQLNWRQVIIPYAKRVLLPFFGILIAYSIYSGEMYWPEYFLLGSYAERAKSFLLPYWFLQSLFYCQLATFLFYLVRKRLAWFAANDSAAALLFLTVTLAMNLIGDQVAVILGHASPYTPTAVIPLFALGWCSFIMSAKGPNWKIIPCMLLTLVVFLPDSIISSSQSLILFALFAPLLFFVGSIPVPKVLRFPISCVASASLQIYLLHTIPVYVFREYDQPARVAITLASSLALGIMANYFMMRMTWFSRVGERRANSVSPEVAT